ncbi:MAG: RNA polymerase sigma-54 factor, partial [Candidatus Dadabacteria bacterium]
MALETKLVQKLSQSLLMTPQLQQAIKLLQLGRQEYIEAIQKELLENPALEEVNEEAEQEGRSKETAGDNKNSDNSLSDTVPEPELTPEPVKDEAPIAWEDYLESFSDYRGAATPKGTVNYEDRPSLENVAKSGEDLIDYVISQIRMADIEKEDQPIVLQVIGNLDKDGYLCSSYEEIAEACGCTVSDVERVMEIFKSIDPPGVGARDLKECLLIQLDNMGLGDGLEARIISNHMEKLERRKYDQIAKLEQVALEEVYQAVMAIQNLEPRPGRAFGTDTARYIIPDIYVYKVGNDWVITLNEDGLPKLRISPYYLTLLKQKSKEDSESAEYLQDRLKAASWLIKSIHQRQATIYKVTESIVKFQKDFLEHGIEHLKPMVLKDVAEDIGMHESTVSRVTTNKYVHTPQGVFELKYFFTTGIKTADGDISSS